MSTMLNCSVLANITETKWRQECGRPALRARFGPGHGYTRLPCG